MQLESIALERDEYRETSYELFIQQAARQPLAETSTQTLNSVEGMRGASLPLHRLRLCCSLAMRRDMHLF